MIPTWAISVFGFAFLTVFSIAAWGIKRAIASMGDDVSKLDGSIGDLAGTVNTIDKRLVRVETIVDGGGPAGVRPRAITENPILSTAAGT